MNPFSKVKPFLSRRAPTFDKLLIRCKLIGLVNRYSPLLEISPRKKRALSHSSTFSISTPTSFITIASVSSVQLTARAHLFTFSFATMGAIYHCYWNVPRAKNFQPFWRFAEMKPFVRRGTDECFKWWEKRHMTDGCWLWRANPAFICPYLHQGKVGFDDRSSDLSVLRIANIWPGCAGNWNRRKVWSRNVLFIF